MPDFIYKVLTLAQWHRAGEENRFDGAPVDVSDGYIHLSTADQVKETVAKHFAGQGELVLLSFDKKDFGSSLKWEPSRGGELFPHLYSSLDLKLAQSTASISMLPDGSHKFPDTF